MAASWHVPKVSARMGGMTADMPPYATPTRRHGTYSASLPPGIRSVRWPTSMSAAASASAYVRDRRRRCTRWSPTAPTASRPAALPVEVRETKVAALRASPARAVRICARLLITTRPAPAMSVSMMNSPYVSLRRQACQRLTSSRARGSSATPSAALDGVLALSASGASSDPTSRTAAACGAAHSGGSSRRLTSSRQSIRKRPKATAPRPIVVPLPGCTASSMSEAAVSSTTSATASASAARSHSSARPAGVGGRVHPAGGRRTRSAPRRQTASQS
mmetsp:Transcript_7820/g.24474  ORF Transcript_7820/g.24474 Transcript_7820/m.24474 type:complete len:276 (-) Transcript_7820:663-1490(-)